MQGLILEGGSFRPVFSAGVMDALLEQDVRIPYVIGVSAGISNGVSYVTKQKGRNLEILQKYRNDKRYMSRRNFLKCRSLFGLDFLYDKIPNELVPFDFEALNGFKGKCYVGATEVSTGTIAYFDASKMDKKCMILRATCALPIFFPAIEIDGKKYYDGGLCAPIPIEKAESDGCERSLIILTQPKGFVKAVGKHDGIGAKIVGRKYPKVKERILNRYKDYNHQVKYCEQLEKEGKAIILRPEYAMNSFESDIKQLEKNYEHGYNMALKQMDVIRCVLGL